MFQNWKAATEILPAHMREGMILYIEKGVRPGSFMQTILENDFIHAFVRADEINRNSLPLYAHFLYEYAPQECWGNRMRVQMWEHAGGLEGRAAKELTETEEN